MPRPREVQSGRMWRALALFAAFSIAATGIAQRGKPAEIVLREGVGAAEGRLKGRQQRTYTVRPTGQVLTVAMSVEPMRSAALEVYDPDGLRLLLQKEAAGRWTTPIGKPGDYRIAVVRATPMAPASVYRLRVEVR